MSKIFEKHLEELGIILSDRQKEQFVKFYELLVEWNKVMNLTGITEYEEVVEKHFVDSLSIVKTIDINRVDTVIDIGTGAGFPGIPLKIAFPHLKITLLDSLNKRIKFLNAVIDELGLENIRVINDRAEILAKKSEYRENFDLCTARAVARLNTLCEYCMPFVKVGGIFLSYKANAKEEVEEAISAVKILGGEITEVFEYSLDDATRTLITVKKKKNTPEKYPRGNGKERKNPL